MNGYMHAGIHISKYTEMNRPTENPKALCFQYLSVTEASK